MSNKKFASDLKPGDKIEAAGGVFVVARAHHMPPTVSMIGTVGGVLTEWAHHHELDEFVVVTVH